MSESARTVRAGVGEVPDGRLRKDAVPAGFDEFVADRSAQLLRTAWMLTGDAHLAEDLLQSALARAWPHWQRIRYDRPEAYLYRVMVNLQASWWRRRWRGEVPTENLPEPGSGSAPGVHGSVEDRVALFAALRTLPLRRRQTVVLRFYLDLSEQQVAAVMGCSLGTVKSQCAKGLAALRAALEASDRERPGTKPTKQSGREQP